MSEPIGFIGLGELGSAIAKRLLATDHKVRVWDIVPEKVDAIVAAGAQRGDKSADIARHCKVVIACVTDTEAVRDVALGQQGLAHAGTQGQIFVDNSTVDPHAAAEMAELLRDRCGMGWIDAPVTGGWTSASRGDLVVMAGGAPEEIDQVRPILSAYAKRITHMGPNGAGQAAKLCNQVIIGATLAGIAEALGLAEKFGLSPADLPDALAGGWADSPLLQDHARRMAAEDYSGSVKIMLKDMDLCRDLSRRLDAPLPVTSLTAELYRKLVADGFDHTGQVGLMLLYKASR